MSETLKIEAGKWKKGMPPGKYYEGMCDDFECYPTPAGGWWHRRRTPEEVEALKAERAARQTEPTP